MKNEYYIKKATELELSDSSVWDFAETAEICCYPWDSNGYRPKTEAKILYTEKGLHVNMVSYENKILATFKKMNDPVYKDSCMEFFFKPNPENDDRYLNFEFNALGTLNLGLGKDRFKRLSMPESTLEYFRIKTSVTEDNVKSFSDPSWSIEFFIPYAFIEEYFGKLKIGSGARLFGNFYKCGELEGHVHFGCWSPVKSEIPDFHRAECFGSLILE